MLPTNLAPLETLIQQGTVRRPIHGFYRKRDYTNRELATLERLECDASKAVGRQLSNSERNTLLEHKAQLIATQSRTKVFGQTLGILTGLVISFSTRKVRGLWNHGRLIHFSWSVAWRTCASSVVFTALTALQIRRQEKLPPLPIKILRDPRMNGFVESIAIRREEFGGHEPILVRSWKELKNPEPPIQWFMAANPQGKRDAYNRPPVFDHPELRWYRAWPSESEGESPDDEEIANRIQKRCGPRDARGRAWSFEENFRGVVYAFETTDLALKPCMYV